MKAGKRAELFRLQGLLVDRRLALGRSLECKDLTNRLSLFVDHPYVIGGVGLQASERGAVIVAAGMLDSIRCLGAKVVGICANCRTKSWLAFEVQATLAELALANSSIGFQPECRLAG